MIPELVKTNSFQIGNLERDIDDQRLGGIWVGGSDHLCRGYTR